VIPCAVEFIYGSVRLVIMSIGIVVSTSAGSGRPTPVARAPFRAGNAALTKSIVKKLLAPRCEALRLSSLPFVRDRRRTGRSTRACRHYGGDRRIVGGSSINASNSALSIGAFKSPRGQRRYRDIRLYRSSFIMLSRYYVVASESHHCERCFHASQSCRDVA